MEREKAQQESNLAVERSQALAAEVVNLEERVLKVRSQELKLEKELKMLMSENASQRSQISSMEKDRTNLRSLIEALQEEKKVLQARLRKAASTVVEDARKSSKEIADASSQAGIRVDVSTSTDDLGMQELPFTQEQRAIIDLATSSASMLAPEPTALIGSTSHAPNNLLVPNPWSSIPSEQSRKIENINVLITELAEEKAALVKTLKAESVAAVDLRALNAELSRKLESQTQQLELAVAQRMAHEGNFVSRNIYEASAAEPEFVDEGDEVVERVLGWIMKLFPGGSSRRGGSKQL
ncbi:hypothetical protein O6H91_22G036400 [Diphasiastrum complanatum]|uniref:Uncharacterized protein n=1 Tax=Diphasiastrum complanatum TaxID=34168 RepID=A0ACC2AGD2_DIPCM|nr:hypothetical protein O6H91_22G036400 [Diphasiastrum complanatum]